MKQSLKLTQFLLLGLAVALVACGDSKDTDDNGGNNADMRAGPAETISYTGVASAWIAGAANTTFTVCAHGTESCTTTDEDGNFTVEAVPANSEVILTFVSDDNARIAFPIITGAEDTTASRSFTVVNRAIADLMVASVPGATGGIDDTKSVLTFYVGNGGYQTLRGLPGVTVSYDGPQTDARVNYIIPTGAAPGVAVGGEGINTSSVTGNGFIANVTTGDYTMTIDAGDRNCTPDFAWPAAEGSPANTFRVPTLEGFATFNFVNCLTEQTVTSNGVVNDFATSTGLAGAEVCLNWGLNEDGSYETSSCQTSSETGEVVHADVPGDAQVLIEVVKEGYMTVIATLETLIDDVNWFTVSPPSQALLVAAATAGVSVDETKGHISVWVLNQTNESLDGFTISLEGSESPVAYFGSGLVDPSLTATSLTGIGGFFNVDPGSYTVNVEKEGVLCTTSSWSWAAGGGYAVPVRANTFTELGVVCIDEPSPRFGEPAEPIDPPMCTEGEAEANCAATCGFFVACGAALCEGLQNVSEWETTSSAAGMQSACEAVCASTPALVETVCAHTSCNDTLSLVVDSQEGFGDFCSNGLPTLLERAAASAAEEDSNLTQVVGLVTASEPVQMALSADGPLTVFLPVDSAFEALEMGVLEMVASDEMLRDSILGYHVVDAGLPAAAVVAAIEGGQDSVDTLGGSVSLALVEGQVVVGGATVIGTDIYAKNGVIHLIDSVILPPAPAQPEPKE